MIAKVRTPGGGGRITMKKKDTDYSHEFSQLETDFNQLFTQNKKHPFKILFSLYRGSYWLTEKI